MDTIYCVECPKELKLPETDRVRRINNNNKPFCDIFFPPKTPYPSFKHTTTDSREEKPYHAHTHAHCPLIEIHSSNSYVTGKKNTIQ